MSIDLFSRGTLGPLSVRNRIVMPAMHLGMSPAGVPGEMLMEMYRRRAAAGVGIVVVGMCNTWEAPDSPFQNVLDLSGDEKIAAMTELTSRISGEGAIAGVQLSPLFGYNRPAVCPPLDRLDEMLESIGLAAARARRAGFQVVELMLSGGSVLSHFLSPAHNTWNLDDYSGSLENRLRAPLAALESIRRHAGDIPVVTRIHGHEFIENGIDLSEAAKIARALERAGVCAIDVTGAGHRTTLPQMTPQRPCGTLAYLGRNIADAVTVPVWFGGQVRTGVDGNRVLSASGASYVTVGRALLADAGWVSKVKNGEEHRLISCIACCHCLDRVFANRPVRCTLDPSMGQTEGAFQVSVQSTGEPRVLVVGSGPAGLSAAIEFASVGCDVTVMEKGSIPGGRVVGAVSLSGHRELGDALSGLLCRLDELGVRIRTDVEVTPDVAREHNADVLLLATGAVPHRVPFVGLSTHSRVLHTEDILQGGMVEGDRVVIVGGNGAGVAVALHLAREGFADVETLGYLLRYGELEWAREALDFRPKRQVTLLKRRGFVGKGIGRAVRWTLVREMALFGVTLQDRAEVQEILPNGVRILDGRSGERVTIAADTVILATGYVPDPEVTRRFSGCAKTVLAAGDVLEVGDIEHAVHSAYDIIHNTAPSESEATS